MRKLVFTSAFSLLLLLLLLCGCGENFDLPEGRDEDGTLNFIYNDEIIASVSFEQITALPNKSKNLQYQSSSLGEVKAEFTGAALSDIIKLADEDILDDYDSLTAYGSDGYFSTLTMDEVKQLNNVFIMYLQDGEYLPVYKGEAEASMRLIVTNDAFGIRFTNYLIDIILTKEE